MKINFNNIPQNSGVYMWLGKSDNILYIGKAKNLKKRMNQYFRGMLNSYKTAKLIKNTFDYKYIITNNEKEALILERNLIQKYMPIYNILLTDDKRYPYIKIKLVKKLEVNLVYRISSQNDNSVYFGPFPFGYGAKKLVNLIQRLTTYEHGLLSQNKSQEYWEKKFEYAKQLLSSHNNFLIKELKSQMIESANNLQYEVAANIKESIEVLKYNQDKQSVEIKNKSNIDVIAFVESKGYLFISMIFYRKGILLSKKQNVLEIINSKQDLIRQFISQYYKINIQPCLIISNEKIETDINVVVPQKGEKKRILNITIKNANDNMSMRLKKYKRKEERTIGALKSLQNLLGIELIGRIIIIDNSNTNNIEPVSGIVSYVNGIKNKKEYRKFKLQKTSRLADVEYIKQALTRYFSKETPQIDLLIVDGGKQQINEAKKIVPSSIQVVGLVKDHKHKTKELLDENGKIINVKDKNLWLFLSEMQIEVDRFAKSYHIKRRKRSLEGILISINGVGPKIEQKLLNYFKNYSNIYNASIEDLKKIVSKKIAIKIKEVFNESSSCVR